MRRKVVKFDSMMTNQQGKPDAGKPHVRFEEGEASRPILGGNLSTLLILSKNSAPASLLSIQNDEEP
jgi:hypothetical protein